MPSVRSVAEHEYSTPFYTDVLERAVSDADGIFFPSDPYSFSAVNSFDNEEGSANHTWCLRIFHCSHRITRQAYSLFLLRLPSMYFARVYRVFRRARCREMDIQKLEEGGGVSPALKIFEDSWAEFIDALLKEWKTLNFVSALLLSAILTLLQIDDAADQAVTRTAASLSLVSALMSLIFGCLYVIRFGTMKNRRKEAHFVEVIKKTRTSIWWNVLVLLAIPAIWLSWSLLFFSVALMSFFWTSGSNKDNPTPPSLTIELSLRIAISTFFLLGLLHLILVIRDFTASHKQGENVQYEESQSGNLNAGPIIDYFAYQKSGLTDVLPSYHGTPLDTGEGWDKIQMPVLVPRLPQHRTRQKRPPQSQVIAAGS